MIHPTNRFRTRAAATAAAQALSLDGPFHYVCYYAYAIGGFFFVSDKDAHAANVNVLARCSRGHVATCYVAR